MKARRSSEGDTPFLLNHPSLSLPSTSSDSKWNFTATPPPEVATKQILEEGHYIMVTMPTTATIPSCAGAEKGALEQR